jgi:hypothetical protein
MSYMRRFWLVGVVALLAVAVAAPGQSKSSANINVTLKIIQGVTERHPHPPDGDAGDVFSVVLTLFAIKPEFGMPAEARVGRMTFSYVLHGKCSAKFGEGCKGTVDVQTQSKLPDGTINAAAKDLPIRAPFVVSIKKGTGRYTGAKGQIVIAPEGQARNVYQITLP